MLDLLPRGASRFAPLEVSQRVERQRSLLFREIHALTNDIDRVLNDFTLDDVFGGYNEPDDSEIMQLWDVGLYECDDDIYNACDPDPDCECDDEVSSMDLPMELPFFSDSSPSLTGDPEVDVRNLDAMVYSNSVLGGLEIEIETFIFCLSLMYRDGSLERAIEGVLAERLAGVIAERL